VTQRSTTAEDGAAHREEIIAGRYRTRGELGAGGMAVIYHVVDVASGRQLALKRPRSDGSPEHRRRIAELFALEFHTLVQLAHPRIVEVYDYGVDEHGPYYTMELLDGGDLQGLMPVDYRRACQIASDVCSALSLLHSRRIVHRDVSPRNIRCTADGLAKLIDFGAMTHMGPSKELVGTPVYCAPEILNMQALDARTDLYALGASLYYALTEHHPYPVREFAGLPNAWRFGVPRPSELVPGIPDALDTLLLDLLQLKPDDRPSNASEVMARLSAIAGTPLDEHLLVAQAYLATPAFIGRRAELSRVEAMTVRTLRKRGTALLVEGPAGSGRSRFLDASLLNSKLQGMTVVRADASDGERDYGVVTRLLRQLQQIVPQLTTELAEPLPILGHIVPELVAGWDVSLLGESNLVLLRPQLQSALQRMFLGIAERTPLLLAIDDMHAIDEPSTATISLLAQQLRDTQLVILATAVSDATPNAPAAFKLFADKAKQLTLGNLTQDEAQGLLASVFGASATLEVLTQRLHALSGGSPRDLMRLAQHLVDNGSARYHAGTWSLPGIDDVALPSSVAQLLSGRLQLLAPAARDLARALALSPEKSFSIEECGRLSDRDEAGALLVDIEQLTKADLLHTLGERVALSDRAWVPLLHQQLEPTQERALHLRLAQVFEARKDDEFRHAQHLLRAGEIERALDTFVAHAIASRALTDRSSEAFHQVLLSLPRDWLATYEQVLRLVHEQQRPKRDEIAILVRLAGFAALIGGGRAPVLTLAMQFKHACGLSDWEKMDPALEPGTRLRRALEQAQARYVASAERDRFADPITAIRELANTVRLSISISALAMDLNSALSVPSLQPLVALAPALAIVEQFSRGVQARLSGRIERAREIYLALLERLASPADTGIDPTHLDYSRIMVLNGVAVLEASSGLATSLDAADKIEKSPTLQSNAWLIRMVHHLWQGNSDEAERCRKQYDMTRMQSSAAQSLESVHLTWQLIAHVAMEDLTRIKRSLNEVAPIAARYPAFRTVLTYGEAEYQRIRGDSARALVSLENVLSTCEAGAHQIWPQLAAAHVRALDDVGQAARAADQGRAYLTEAARAEIGPSAQYWISLALCVVEAKLGQAGALQTAEAVIEHCVATGATGLKLGLAYEARARVALLQLQAADFERYRALCEQEFAKAANPALSAKLQKLKREAQKRQLVSQAPRLHNAQRNAANIDSRLRASGDAAARARDILSLLAEHSGAVEGYLFQIRHDGPTWVASLRTGEPDDVLHAMVREYVMAEVQANAQSTGASELAVQTDWTAFGEALYRPVLLSHFGEAGCTITGVAVFVVSPGRPFAHPGEIATQVSRMTLEVGDVTGLIVVE
jgi:tRNA A-37 threonylcarbamoyl transferase component Bud32